MKKIKIEIRVLLRDSSHISQINLEDFAQEMVDEVYDADEMLGVEVRFRTDESDDLKIYYKGETAGNL